MSNEELDAAINKLLEETEYPETSGRSRAYRRKMKYLKATKLYNILANSGYAYRSKGLSNYDKGYLKNIHGSGVYITGTKRSTKRAFFQRQSARKIRQYKDKVLDGNRFHQLIYGKLAWILT